MKAMKEIFSYRAQYIAPADLKYDFPKNGSPEIAFVGRSNVGKSSLIENLLGNKGLLRISKEPGCTKILNFFALTKKEGADPAVYLVDMPGYGFAKVSQTQQKEWLKIMKTYLVTRDQLLLRRVFVLLDGRRGIQQADFDTMQHLDSAMIPYQVIFTKRDLVSDQELYNHLQNLFTFMKTVKNSTFLPIVHTVSSTTGEGMDALKLAITEISQRIEID